MHCSTCIPWMWFTMTWWSSQHVYISWWSNELWPMTVHGIAKINDLANSISFEVLEMSPFGLICVMKYSRSISTSNILVLLLWYGMTVWNLLCCDICIWAFGRVWLRHLVVPFFSLKFESVHLRVLDSWARLARPRLA
jgi:hypothetical protein